MKSAARELIPFTCLEPARVDSTLLVSLTRTDFGDRAFSAAGPRVCNYLPTDLRQLDLSYSRFRQSLKHFNGQWDLTAL